MAHSPLIKRNLLDLMVRINSNVQPLLFSFSYNQLNPKAALFKNRQLSLLKRIGMQIRVCPKMPGNASIRPANRLTNIPKYSSVLHGTTGYRANHAECANTPHSSNPTLFKPVSGLHSIIQPRMIPVLRGWSSPTDSSVGVGCSCFLVWKRTC